MEIRNSIAFVTGANRGLGLHLVSELLKEGAAKVYAGARDIDAVDAPWKGDSRVSLVRIDVTDTESVKAAAAHAADATLLINNAGTLRFGTALDGSLDAYQADLETNLFGTIRATRAFVPHLTSNAPGAVVNISSIIGLAPARGMVGYSISKAAVHSFTQGLRAELHGTGIDVVAVYPAQIDTDMLKGVDAPKVAPELVAEQILTALRTGAHSIYPEASSTHLATVYTEDPWRLEKILSGTTT